jgi:hypothetical protein
MRTVGISICDCGLLSLCPVLSLSLLTPLLFQKEMYILSLLCV